MWIENPAGAPYVPVPQTCSVMLEAVLLTQLIPGVVRSGLGGGGPPAITGAAATKQHKANAIPKRFPTLIAEPPFAGVFLSGG
jgi:hypothetical protein